MSRWIREIPLLAGIIAGCMGLWWHGRAFVPMVWPAGFDWERYLRETWAYMHPGTMNSTWLEPLYSYILGHLGPYYGWAWTGILISSVAAVMVVVGAGLLGRALSGPWAGAVAAISIPLTPQLAAAARWVNLYPLLSGTTALGLAGAVGLARWRTWPWAVLAGVGSGLAWAIDGRTVTLLPGLILLALTGVVGVPQRWKQVLLLGLFGAGLSIGPVSQTMLRVVPREGTAEVAEILRGIELSKLRNSPNNALRTACANEPSGMVSLDGLIQPCAIALQADNAERVDDGLPWGLSLTLGLFLLALLPGNGGRRQSWIAAIALIPFLAMTLVMSRWIIVTPRYMMQIAAPAAVVVPVAAAQLWRTLLRGRQLNRLAFLAPMAIGAWLIWSGPSHEAIPPLEASSTYKMMAPVVSLIENEMGPDDVLLDCSESHIEVAVLPRVLHGGSQNHEGHDWARCASWLKDPEGQAAAYVVVGSRTQISGLRSLSLPPPWQQVLRKDGQGQTTRVWKLEAGFNL